MTRKFLIAVGLLIAVLTGCESDPKPLEVSEVEELEATVIAVDAQARTLVLRGPDGNDVGLNVGPDVRNLSQVDVRRPVAHQAHRVGTDIGLTDIVTPDNQHVGPVLRVSG